VNINDAILEVMALTKGELERNCVKTADSPLEHVASRCGRPGPTAAVILNLVANAIEAMSG
jgi:hypothetical protein